MISVCMATFNGERYITQQLSSILQQLNVEDEVIVVDDNSSDETLARISEIDDSKVKIIENQTNIGPIKSFEKAILNSHGSIVFLSDQDDLWMANKVSDVMKAFMDPQVMMVVHDAIVTDKDLNTVNESWNHYNGNHFSAGLGSIVLKNKFTGSMMAFRRSIETKVLPFPAEIPMHDWWIAVVCLQEHYKIVALPAKLMKYRRHDSSVTGHGHNLFKMLKGRYQLIISLLALRRE